MRPFVFNLFLASLLIVSGCSEQPKASIIGFDGSVVKMGISNHGAKLVSTPTFRRSITEPRAVKFCIDKGFSGATYQQEITEQSYALGPQFRHIAYLCE
ncbi:hypothetical protein [Paracoccus fistulariae]|uniref:Lipoprotein n=1 Tax=Paracoccus fistulariae TaxID=658446 RepID=A0ABY7SIV7_9RHOB|nr:hypothetical protein [Paracoccus fistulariae]MDB6181979.1 hypothetical protein [Paracoccus fistulariae]WCR06784.1 hypothetical protein JHX87_15095 [Paracoccus fistulariae]